MTHQEKIAELMQIHDVKAASEQGYNEYLEALADYISDVRMQGVNDGRYEEAIQRNFFSD